MARESSSLRSTEQTTSSDSMPTPVLCMVPRLAPMDPPTTTGAWPSGLSPTACLSPSMSWASGLPMFNHQTFTSTLLLITRFLTPPYRLTSFLRISSCRKWSRTVIGAQATATDC
ncbi:hypothetical protein BX600DRAFT_157502 [Xylariales sp. PMI_506]|nr:hypothetical protein BX600DRAFT_157502 [Xylariales sp. PMI_506]